MKEYIVTVMARDRVGIVRDVSSALASLGGNITNVSQTVMHGYFTLIMSVIMPSERTEIEIRQAVERHGEVGELVVNVRPFVEPIAHVDRPAEHFTLSLRGNDSQAIIGRVTTYLSERTINIDDFYAYAHDGRFVMLVQVSIPDDVDVEEVQSELEQLGIEFGLTVHLQHADIFRATSDIKPIMV